MLQLLKLTHLASVLFKKWSHGNEEAHTPQWRVALTGTWGKPTKQQRPITAKNKWIYIFRKLYPKKEPYLLIHDSVDWQWLRLSSRQLCVRKLLQVQLAGPAELAAQKLSSTYVYLFCNPDCRYSSLTWWQRHKKTHVYFCLCLHHVC